MPNYAYRNAAYASKWVIRYLRAHIRTHCNPTSSSCLVSFLYLSVGLRFSLCKMLAAEKLPGLTWRCNGMRCGFGALKVGSLADCTPSISSGPKSGSSKIGAPRLFAAPESSAVSVAIDVDMTAGAPDRKCDVCCIAALRNDGDCPKYERSDSSSDACSSIFSSSDANRLACSGISR